MKKPNLSIHDIAALTGYSIATVSRALNGKKNGNMKEDTYRKIIEVVQESGYVPNQLSAGFRSGVTKIIGIILPSNLNPYYALLSNQIERQAFNYGYLTYVCNSEYDVKKEIAYIRHLQAQKVSMIFLCSSGLSRAEIEEFDNNEKKIVLLDEEVKNYSGYSIVINDYLGGLLGTEYLLSRNITDILFITGPKQLCSTRERLRGAARALINAGKEMQKENILYGDYSINTGKDLMENVLKTKGLSFSAIFCFSDFMAMGVYEVLKSNGISIPEKVSIMGYDNIFFDELLNPSITTVATPVEEIAEIALNLIIKRNDYNDKKKMVVNPYIIERESIMPMARL